MKIVAIIPIKGNSKRVKNKNIRKVFGKPLFSYLIDKLEKCNFDEIYVDTDIDPVKRYVSKKKINVINRKPYLSKDSANGNDLINFHAKIIKADLYFQLFVTSPLLSVKTINDCIRILKNNKKIDSIFTAKKIFSWFWFNNKPVNYFPKILPRSQDAKPIVMETTGLYGIKSDILKKEKCRIGKKPHMYFAKDHREALDIDNEEDIELFKFLLKR